MSAIQATKQQLRSFGLIVGAGFAIIGLFPLVFGRGIRTWALIVAAILVGAGLVLPAVLRPLFRVWMAIAEVLGWVNTRIILLLVYCLVIVPIGWILRLSGKDLLNLKLDPTAESYRIPRTPRNSRHMQQQY
jgi:hypothetical protein